MTKRKEGDETNWWSELHIKLEKKGDGYVSYKLGNMEYIMKYATFLKVDEKLKEDYSCWKGNRKGRKK